MRASGLSTLGASAGTYTPGMKCRTVHLAVPPKRKFLHAASKVAAEAKGLCSGLQLIVYFAPDQPLPVSAIGR